MNDDDESVHLRLDEVIENMEWLDGELWIEIKKGVLREVIEDWEVECG